MASKALADARTALDTETGRSSLETAPEARAGQLLPPPDSDQDGFAVMLVPQDDHAEDISNFAALDPEDLHCTLVFYGDRSDYEDRLTGDQIADFLRSIAQSMEPISATLGGITRFSAKDRDPVVLNVDSKDVHVLRQRVMDVLSDEADITEQTEHGYTSHMTLGYLPVSEPMVISRWQPMKIVFDRIRVGFGGDNYDIALGTGIDVKSVRRVRDAAFWGKPVGTPIVPGMRPASRAVSRAVSRGTQPPRKRAAKKALPARTRQPAQARTVAEFAELLTPAARRDYDTLDEPAQRAYRMVRGFSSRGRYRYRGRNHAQAFGYARSSMRERQQREANPRITLQGIVDSLGPRQRQEYDALNRTEQATYRRTRRSYDGRLNPYNTHARTMQMIQRRRAQRSSTGRPGNSRRRRPTSRSRASQYVQANREEWARIQEERRKKEKELERLAKVWTDKRAERKAKSVKPGVLKPKDIPAKGYDTVSLAELPEDIQIALSHAFEVEVGDLRTEINLGESTASRSVLRINGYVMKGNKIVGNFERSVRLEDKSIYNELLEITDKTVQGQGLSDALYDAAESTMYQQGIRKINVGANIDVGGYAWARRGFQFKHSAQARDFGKMLERQLDAIEEARKNNESFEMRSGHYASIDVDAKTVPDSFIAVARALAKKAQTSPTSVSPNDFASLGEGEWFLPDIVIGSRQNKRTIPAHFGKYFMLGTTWDGERKLDSSVVKKDLHTDWMQRVRALYGAADELFAPDGFLTNPEDSDYNVMFLDLYADLTDTEVKAVRRVSTVEGVRRYNLPLGSIIGSRDVPQVLPLDIDEPDPKLNKPRDFERLSKRSDINDVRTSYDHFVARLEAIYNREEEWGGYWKDDPAHKFYEDYGIDPDDDPETMSGDGSIANMIALGPWVGFDACRDIRRAAYDLLGFKSTDQRHTRGDAHIHGGSPDWGRGSSVNDPELHAYALMLGVREGTKSNEPMYRGVGMVDAESFIQQLREGDTFDMPLASFVNSRERSDIFGTDVTFVLEKGARAVQGADMGPTPSQERAMEEGLDYYYDEPENFEYISGGRFRIRTIRKNRNGWTIQIRQTAVFDPQTGVLTKTGNKFVMPTFSWMFDRPLVSKVPAQRPKRPVQQKDVYTGSGPTAEGGAVPRRGRARRPIIQRRKRINGLRARAVVIRNMTSTEYKEDRPSLEVRALAASLHSQHVSVKAVIEHKADPSTDWGVAGRAFGVFSALQQKGIERDIETKIRKRRIIGDLPRDGDGDGWIFEGTPYRRRVPSAPNFKFHDEETPGWPRFEGADGVLYYVGHDDNNKVWVATGPDEWDDVVVDDQPTFEATLKELNDYIAARVAVKKKAPAKKAVKKTVAKKPLPKPTTKKRAAAAVDPTKPKAVGKYMDVKGQNEDPALLKNGTRRVGPRKYRDGTKASRVMVELKPGSKEEAAARAKYGIPPAYTHVWLNASRDETANDNEYDGFVYSAVAENGKRQPKYSKRHGDLGAKKKFGGSDDQGNASEGDVGLLVKNWTKVIRQVENDASGTGKKAEAAKVVLLQSMTGLRIGSQHRRGVSDADRRFGASTLEARHITVNQNSVRFAFMAPKGSHKRFNPDGSPMLNPKGRNFWPGKMYEVTIRDKRLVTLMTEATKGKSRRDPLFNTTDSSVNAYLKDLQSQLKITGGNITSHNFRHSVATTIAMKEIAKTVVPKTEAEYKAKQKAIAEKVGAVINDTVKEALTSYIQHSVWDGWTKSHPDWRDAL